MVVLRMRHSFRRAMAACFAALCLASFAAGGDTAAAPAGPSPSMAAAIAAAGLGRMPVPGEWLEYLICHPADPLESSLLPDAGAQEDAPAPTVISFDAPVTWAKQPLRLEFNQIDADGCHASMTFAGRVVAVTLPLPQAPQKPESGDGAESGGDSGSAAAAAGAPRAVRTEMVRIGAEMLEAEIRHGEDEGGWFVRYSNPDIPFGLVRFACESADIVLVARGTGLPPDFPEKSQPFNPPPGSMRPK